MRNDYSQVDVIVNRKAVVSCASSNLRSLCWQSSLSSSGLDTLPFNTVVFQRKCQIDVGKVILFFISSSFFKFQLVIFLLAEGRRVRSYCGRLDQALKGVVDDRSSCFVLLFDRTVGDIIFLPPRLLLVVVDLIVVVSLPRTDVKKHYACESASDFKSTLFS